MTMTTGKIYLRSLWALVPIALLLVLWFLAVGLQKLGNLLLDAGELWESAIDEVFHWLLGKVRKS